MKIAIVCGHYLPELGYLEVHLARALVQLNYEVAVITSSAVPAYVENKVKDIPETGLSDDHGVRVIRLKPVFALGQLVWSKGIWKTIQSLDPELVIAIGLGKVFPKPILRKAPYNLAVLLGDNANTYSKTSWRQRIIQRLLKKPVYEKAMTAADAIFSYTPETISVLKDWISEKGVKKAKAKNTFLSLGFDQNAFYYSLDLRREGREELKVEDGEVLLISVARMGANKNYSDFIQSIAAESQKGWPMKCLFVGVGDDEYSTILKKQIAQSGVAERFITKPFLNHSALNRLYNAADIGYWPITAISIYEGMGTGLYLLVPESGSLSHLPLDGQTGQYVEGNLQTDLELALKNHRQMSRQDRSEKSLQTFSYQAIARRLLETMKSV